MKMKVESKMNGKISVIVPVYDVEPYLRKCVDSILAQTYTNLEIILVDDGSPDKCGAICDEYAQKDERVKVFHKENGGVSSARNTGLDAAKGEYIAFIDADDYVPKDYFEALHKDMTGDVDMVRCGIDSCLPDGGGVYSRQLKSTVTLDSFAPENFREYINYYCWGVLYKRSVIGDLRFNTDYYAGEDMLFYYSSLKSSNKIKYTMSTKYCYVQRSESAWHSMSIEKRYTDIFAHQDICQLYADNAEIREILEAEYVHCICYDVLNSMRFEGINDTKKIKYLKHEIRLFLPQCFKSKHRKSELKNYILSAFLPEKIYRFVMMSYYFVRNRKLYEQLKGKWV